MSRLEPFIAKLVGSKKMSAVSSGGKSMLSAYRKEMPYWWTCSKPFFHTSVTSHACVADRRQERKAETALPPTRCCLSACALVSTCPSFCYRGRCAGAMCIGVGGKQWLAVGKAERT